VVTLHAFFALLGGYAVMTLLVVAITALLAKLTPSWVGQQGNPSPTYALVNLGYSFLAAGAGGYVTALVGADNPLAHVLVLGIVVLLLAAFSAVQARGKQPVWYAVSLLVIMPTGVLVGGLIRLQVLGIL